MTYCISNLSKGSYFPNHVVRFFNHIINVWIDSHGLINFNVFVFKGMPSSNDTVFLFGLSILYYIYLK